MRQGLLQRLLALCRSNFCPFVSGKLHLGNSLLANRLRHLRLLLLFLQVLRYLGLLFLPQSVLRLDRSIQYRYQKNVSLLARFSL